MKNGTLQHITETNNLFLGIFGSLKRTYLSYKNHKLMSKALDLVIKKDYASPELLQNELKISPEDSSIILNALYKTGVISKENGAKPREVLIDTSGKYVAYKKPLSYYEKKSYFYTKISTASKLKK